MVAGGGGVGEGQPHPILDADAIVARHPARLVQKGLGLFRVIFVLRQVGIEVEGLLRHVGLGRGRNAIVKRVDDRLLVQRMIQRLADLQVLELRPLHVERDGFEGRRAGDLNHPVGKRLGLFVMVGRDPLQAHDVDVAGLELGVKDGEVGDVLDHQPLKIGAVAEVVGVGLQFDMVARHPFLPLEGAGPDRGIVERGLVLVGHAVEGMFRHDEGRGQDRGIGGEGLVHRPGDLGRRDHGQVANMLVPGPAPAAEIRVQQEFQRELDVFGGEGRAVMPFHVVTKRNLPVQTVCRDAAVLDGRNLFREQREEAAVRSHIEQRVEDGIVDALIHLDMRQVRVEHRRFLREAQDDLALWCFLSIGGAKAGKRRCHCGHPGGPHHEQCLPACGGKAVVFGHLLDPCWGWIGCGSSGRCPRGKPSRQGPGRGEARIRTR